MRARWAVVVVVALVLAGCATPKSDGPESDGPGALAPGAGGSMGGGSALEHLAPVDPVELVNLWRVLDAEGETDATWLRLDGGSYQLWRDCGFLEGGWTGSSAALFIASAPFALSGECAADDGWPSVPWLEGARGLERTGTGWTLLGPDGAALARLVLDGAPEPLPTAADFYAQPPEVTDEVRTVLTEPTPLPDALVAPTTAQLGGRWVPEASVPNDPYVVLDEDGTWAASDGCNQSTGAWAAGAGGRFLGTSGISTLIGCDGAPVGSWVGTAERVGLDGGTLVLLDRDGSELGRLVQG